MIKPESISVGIGTDLDLLLLLPDDVELLANG